MITSIENLSNELFYEIFDYLNGMDIYESFSNLNYRFKQLLNCSSLLFKIKLEYSMYNKKVVKNYKAIYLFNRHKIISIDFWLSPFTNNYFSLFSFDSSFARLHTIVAERFQSIIVILFITNLSSLPRLSSLTIGIIDNFEDLNEIHELIFSLSTLKYNKLTLFREEISTPLSIIGNKQLNNLLLIIVVFPMNFFHYYRIHHNFVISVIWIHSIAMKQLKICCQ